MKEPELNVEAWEEWVAYRKRIKKPLKEANYPWTQKGLAKYGADQLSVVRQSMEREWQGLFPIKEVADFSNDQVSAPW